MPPIFRRVLINRGRGAHEMDTDWVVTVFYRGTSVIGVLSVAPVQMAKNDETEKGSSTATSTP